MAFALCVRFVCPKHSSCLRWNINIRASVNECTRCTQRVRSNQLNIFLHSFVRPMPRVRSVQINEISHELLMSALGMHCVTAQTEVLCWKRWRPKLRRWKYFGALLLDRECDKCINSKLKINYVRFRGDLLPPPPPPNRFILPEMISLCLHFHFSLLAHVPVEPVMPPYQIIRDPSGQFVFLPTATSMGMLRSHDIFHFN